MVGGMIHVNIPEKKTNYLQLTQRELCILPRARETKKGGEGGDKEKYMTGGMCKHNQREDKLLHLSDQT